MTHVCTRMGRQQTACDIFNAIVLPPRRGVKLSIRFDEFFYNILFVLAARHLLYLYIIFIYRYSVYDDNNRYRVRFVKLLLLLFDYCNIIVFGKRVWYRYTHTHITQKYWQTSKHSTGFTSIINVTKIKENCELFCIKARVYLLHIYIYIYILYTTYYLPTTYNIGVCEWYIFIKKNCVWEELHSNEYRKK